MATFIFAGFGILIVDALIRNPWITLLGILLPLYGVYGLAEHTLDWCMKNPTCPVG